MRSRLAVLAVFGLAAVLPAFGHHSFAAEYDANQPITIKGKVSKVDEKVGRVWVKYSVGGDDREEAFGFTNVAK